MRVDWKSSKLIVVAQLHNFSLIQSVLFGYTPFLFDQSHYVYTQEGSFHIKEEHRYSPVCSPCILYVFDQQVYSICSCPPWSCPKVIFWDKVVFLHNEGNILSHYH